jgi:ferredoxin
MAIKITDECINCGACEPECPNTAIYEGGVNWVIGSDSHDALSSDHYYIAPEKCTECVGFNDAPACAAACPVDSCVVDDSNKETHEQLLAKKENLDKLGR